MDRPLHLSVNNLDHWNAIHAQSDQKRRNSKYKYFVIRPEERAGSPLDVEGMDLGITTAEIVQFIREGRKVYEADSD